MKFKFQLFSDLHQEFITNFFKIPPLADYLFLAGDIHKIDKSNFNMFFDYVSKNWKHVFYVPGNHEYYNRYDDIFELKSEYIHYFKNNYNNIHYLDDEYYTLILNNETEKNLVNSVNNIANDNVKKIVIIGSTLWSFVSNIDGINDFKNIRQSDNNYKQKGNKSVKLPIIEENNNLITKETFNELHKNSTEFLNKNLNIFENEKIIVVTHFPPVQKNTSSLKHINEKQHVNDYFASNILHNYLQKKDNILCWIHGHTHHSNDFIDDVTGIRVISNQLGYLKELKYTNMDVNGMFEIEL
jgi:predicted phosphohydrolase